MSDHTTDLPQQYSKFVRRWKLFHGLLLTIHFIAGSAAVVAPLAVGTELFGEVTERLEPSIAFFGAAAAALVVFLRPEKYAAGFFQAYNNLEIALHRFSVSAENDEDRERLINSFSNARDFIGKVQPKRT
ncbi:MAG: hypothetical protein AAGA08_05840 [Pseudomonadota bacterium]